MLTPHKKDSLHKAWLCRILAHIADDSFLPSVLYFKGGTCASMLGWLDRFSVDLDFDYAGTQKEIPKTRTALKKIFNKLSLSIKDTSKNGVQYFLKYEAQGRNTLKIDTTFPLSFTNTYAPQRFLEIDRVFICQTIETMFAHKLLAVMDRQKKHGSIAGRDIYDIHHFFLKGYSYSSDVLREIHGTHVKVFFEKLYAFIEERVTDKLVSEDLNYLLPAQKFQLMRKVLKKETLNLLRDEISRL
ncbi:nucleotidyl transferase AbiEii/AbiGii toxin family protein [Candidatus Uhrbacteria bacterium]|nr:nucleotidyl transferase AbiEii/AbiGii toxin family protein [Candidatus Uhrbacteria bacterium]